MSKKIAIAGLEFDLNFTNKINKQPISINEISKQPLANIYKADNFTPEVPIYTVNILSYIPTDIEAFDLTDQSSFYVSNKKIAFKYSGVALVETEVTTENANQVTCRNFEVVYDGPEGQKEFDLYQIQFNYSFTNPNLQAVEAIFVQDQNLDPTTDRGTVITPRRP